MVIIQLKMNKTNHSNAKSHFVIIDFLSALRHFAMFVLHIDTIWFVATSQFYIFLPFDSIVRSANRMQKISSSFIFIALSLSVIDLIVHVLGDEKKSTTKKTHHNRHYALDAFDGMNAVLPCGSPKTERPDCTVIEN